MLEWGGIAIIRGDLDPELHRWRMVFVDLNRIDMPDRQSRAPVAGMTCAGRRQHSGRHRNHARR
jgi:hypothetical protein